MPYLIHCACGNGIQVEATQAGSTTACRCGALVHVPNLSTLRKQAGEQTLGRDLLAEIRRQIKSGEYPPKGLCPLTSDQPNCVVQVHVQCEKSWQKADRSLAEQIAYLLVFGWMGAFLGRQSNPPETLGRDTEILLPLRIRSEAKQEFLRLKPAKLKALFVAYPLYRELLEKYPNATVTHMDD